MKTQTARYTKDSGEISDRELIIVSKPRENYLAYDVSNLEPDVVLEFVECLNIIEQVREEVLSDFERISGVNVGSLWRSFKPGGLKFTNE